MSNNTKFMEYSLNPPHILNSEFYILNLNICLLENLWKKKFFISTIFFSLHPNFWIMKRISLIILAVLFSLTNVYSQSKKKVEQFVKEQISTYPKIHLVDIYKSCCQDFMGSEHMISDRASVHNYLLKELSEANGIDRQTRSWEACGIEGDYVRIDLNVVIDGLIDADSLTNWFIESANYTNKHSLEDWIQYWQAIESVVDGMNLNLPDYEKEKQFISDMLKKGQYACSHSSEYRDTYKPHYRIISKDVLKKHNIRIE